MEDQEIKAKWIENTTKAKSLYSGRNKMQMEIASLALEVVEITRGGSKYRNLYTLTRFAAETGIAMKSLSTWIAVRKLVYDKAPKYLTKDATFTQLAYVAERLDKNASNKEIEDLLKKATNKSDVDRKLGKYVRVIRSMSYLFCTKNAAVKAEDKILEEILFYMSRISRAIHKDRKEIKPKNNNISATYDCKHISASKAFGVESNHSVKSIVVKDGNKILITEKDQKIAHFLKKNPDKYFSPTELGQKLGGHSYSSASAWSGRSIRKLMELGYVERNNLGHYKWIGA